jgi:hypothetical protein
LGALTYSASDSYHLHLAGSELAGQLVGHARVEAILAVAHGLDIANIPIALLEVDILFAGLVAGHVGACRVRVWSAICHIIIGLEMRL